jgi:CHAT domain-containing protein
MAIPARPLESGLLLAQDDWLTLRDLLAQRIPGSRLAVLSACETGIPGTELPDEVIGLPTGLQQVGVAGVIASLWSVSDISTALLVTRFYHLWRGDGLEPPEALRQAQIWLRDTTNGEKKAYFQQFLPEFSPKQELMQHMFRHVAEQFYRFFVFEDNDTKAFAHPFYWAAFHYVGV